MVRDGGMKIHHYIKDINSLRQQHLQYINTEVRTRTATEFKNDTAKCI